MASSSGADPDSTLALLSSDLPAVPDYPCPDDSGEEEVFFGRKSDKEKNGKFSVFTSRPNMDQDRLDRLHRRSWQVGKEPGAASGGQEGGEGSKANFCRYRDRKSLYSASASIEEEEDDDQEGVKDDSENHPPSGSKGRGGGESRTLEELAKPLKELRLASKTNTPEAANDQVRKDSKEDRVRSRSPLNISGRIRESSSKYGGEGSGDGITEVQESREEENEEDDSSARPEGKPESEILRRLGEEARLASVSASPARSEVSLNSSAASEWFDNTHDEMILFERYGEGYDEVVAAMTTEEKRKLKREVARMTPKSAAELLGEQSNQALEDLHEEGDGSRTPVNEEQEEEEVRTPIPKPRTKTPQKQQPTVEDGDLVDDGEEEQLEKSWEKARGFSPRVVDSVDALKALRDDLKLALSPEPKKEEEKREEIEKTSKIFDTPKAPSASRPSPRPLPVFIKQPMQPSPGSPTKKFVPTQTRKIPKTASQPTASKSGGDAAFRTPPKKQQASSKFFPTPGSSGGRHRATPRSLARTPSYMHPTSASKHRASPKKNPITNETLEVTICSRHGYAHGPESSPDRHHQQHHQQQQHKDLLKKRLLPSAINLDRVVSPVAQYIRRHPAPPLIRQVKPGINRAQADEAVAAAAAAEDENPAPSTGHRNEDDCCDFASLPEAVYRPSRVAVEKSKGGPSTAPALPKSFGKVDNVEAVVVRHVAREKVRAEAIQGLSSASSPSKNRHLKVQERPVRESEVGFGGGGESGEDSSLIEMSIREVKKVVV